MCVLTRSPLCFAALVSLCVQVGYVGKHFRNFDIAVGVCNEGVGLSICSACVAAVAFALALSLLTCALWPPPLTTS